jgi:hypothetical protein
MGEVWKRIWKAREIGLNIVIVKVNCDRQIVNRVRERRKGRRDIEEGEGNEGVIDKRKWRGEKMILNVED